MTQPEGLRSSLHRLFFERDDPDRFLEQLTVLAADSIDADTGCGVTVIHRQQATTVAYCDERSISLDEVQYARGDGPCLHAARADEVVVINDLSADTRWPDYREVAWKQGLRSSLSIPLTLDDESGALNVYAFEPHVFGEREQATLGQFCDEASRAISLALRYDRATQQLDHLHTAMATRRVIDQALGVLMTQNRCSAGEAFEILRRASQNRNVKINRLATDIIRTVTGNDADTDTHWQP